jgi:hypothetical protein
MTAPVLGLVVQEDHGSAIYFEKHASNPGSSGSVSLASVPILAGRFGEQCFNRWIKPADHPSKTEESSQVKPICESQSMEGVEEFDNREEDISETISLSPSLKASHTPSAVTQAADGEREFGRNEGFSPKTRDVSRGVKVTAVKVLDAGMPIDNADQAAPETSKKWKDFIDFSKITPGIRKARKDFVAAHPIVTDGYYIGVSFPCT